MTLFAVAIPDQDPRKCVLNALMTIIFFQRIENVIKGGLDVYTSLASVYRVFIHSERRMVNVLLMAVSSILMMAACTA